MPPNQPLRVHHSLIAEDALIDLVGEAYNLGSPITCRLFSTNSNDHYLITSSGVKAMLRIYHHDHYWLPSAGHYHFELDWLDFLHQQHLPVSYPLPQRNGALLGTLIAPEGLRYYALFSFAPGIVRYPLTVAQCEILGAQLAKIHQASSSFTTQHPRHHFDLAFLLDDAIERIRPFLADQPAASMRIIETTADIVRAQVAQIIRTDASYGVIGGDFHGYNNHFTDSDDLTFFDFELCGYGWRAYELAVFLWSARSNAVPDEQWQAVLQGYQTVRPLTQVEQAAMPAFVYARHIWLMGAFTRVRERFGDAWLNDAFWVSRVQTLRLWLNADQARESDP